MFLQLNVQFNVKSINKNLQKKLQLQGFSTAKNTKQSK